MTTRSAVDRAAIWLGLASLASLIFLATKREVHFVQIPKAGIAVAIVFGLAAIAGGLMASRALTLIAGAGFFAAAIAQLVLQTNASSLADGSNGSTFGLWLGLGIGLVALALTRQPNHTRE